jgi:DNA-binding HxlR family transcriptional regulator
MSPMNEPTPATPAPSAIGSALLLVGDQWNLLILQQAFLRHVRRFADWRDSLDVADSVLSARIRELVAADVLAPGPYRTSGRRRTEYRLTEKGLPLWQFLVAIWSWEQAWVDPGGRDSPAAARLEHLTCGRFTVPELGCRTCSAAPVTARDTSVTTGPEITFRRVAVARHHRRTVRDRDRTRADSYRPQTLEILGDRWSTVLLVAAFLRVRRFADFQRELGIAPGVLSDRLGRFQELGVLRRVRTGVDREEYRLTDKGLGFFPVFAFLLDWAQRWYPQPPGTGLAILHHAGGHPFQPFLRCAQCRQPMARQQLRFELVPQPP